MGIFDKIKDIGSKIIRPAGPKIDWSRIIKPVGPVRPPPGLKPDNSKIPRTNISDLINRKPKDPNWKAPPPGVIHPTNGPKISISDFNKIKGHLK